MELMTVKEVARRLRVSASLVYQLVDCGRLGCHRIGNGRGAIRIRPEDVASYLQSCRKEGGKA
jgi:excisionase family DNA binding protein